MKEYGISCTLLHIVEAENENDAIAQAKDYLNTEFICVDDFNDIECSLLREVE